jgi:hypothetical protein
MQNASGRRGFTVIELLVIIGILTLLIALLLPSVYRARRRALLLVSPLAYSGDNVGQIHFTNAHGSTDVTVDLPKPYFSISSIRWSPSGETLATLVLRLGTSSEEALAIVWPVSGKVKIYTDVTEDTFVGLLDDDRFVVRDENSLIISVRSTETGAIIQSIPPQDLDYHLYRFRIAPPMADGRYVGVGFSHGDTFISWYRKDFRKGRLFWLQERHNGNLERDHMGIDPQGEWVAWTHRINPTNGNPGAWRIGIKNVKAPPSTPPLLIGDSYGYANFIDWTPDGNIMAYVGGFPYPVILNKQGILLNKLQASVGSQASFRTYTHQ